MPRPITVYISGVDRLSATLVKSSKGLDKFGAKARRIGKSMTIGLTLPIVAAGAASFNMSNTFNEGLAQVGTLIPGQIKRVQDLGKAVRGLAIETGKGTEDINAGLYQTISAFGDSEETVDRLTVALRAATAGGAETQSTLSMLSGTTKAYGDTSVKALQHVSDLAFKTVELGETSFPELAAEMGKVNSLAVTLGISQEELFASFAAGTGPLGNTSSVATKLAGSMVALLKPSGDMQIAFKKLGVSSGKQLIAQKGLRGAMQAVSDVADKYGVSLAKIFGRSEGLQFALSMTGAQAEEFETKLGKLNMAAGATDKAYKEVTEGVNKAGFQFKQFQQRVSVLAIDLGNSLAPALIGIMDKITPTIKRFMNLDDRTKKIILTIGGVVAAIGPLLVTIGFVASGIAKLSLVVRGLSLAMSFLAANPIGAVITGIGLLILLVITVIRHWDFFKKFFISMWEKIASVFRSKIGAIITVLFPFIGIPLTIAANWEKVVKVFSKVLNVGAAVGSKVKNLFGFGDSSLRAKTGLLTSDGVVESPGRINRAAEFYNAVNRNETTTNIKIENKSDAKVRTQIEKGTINLESTTGEVLPALG